MDMISGFLAQSQPKPQSAYSTILTLCDRLKHATHLEDRRSAILSLKGLSKEYREAVAEGALRGLINALITDKEDNETVRAALETLLILFLGGVNQNPGPARTNNSFRRQRNGKYPSPVLLDANVDNFALWLTYQFTEKEENIKALLDLTKSQNTFIRLYSLQLLGAIVANRPSRAQQCISLLKGEDGEQGGVGTLVSLLDDNSALVRTECMLVLTSLVEGHTDIQLLVAFEMAFPRLFSIIEQEGGIEGDITVEYALTLIGNLLRYNVMNQNDFRETTDGISQLSNLLDIPQDMNWNEQSIQNTRMVFDIIRILVPPGTEVTRGNQQALFRCNIHSVILKIIFGASATLAIRSDALLTIAEMIRSNQDNQDAFSQFDVPYVDLNIIGNVQRDPTIIPVIQALLNWSLLGASVHIFDLRASAALCIEAYFKDNEEGKMAFLEGQTQQLQAAYNFSDESIVVDNENANIFKTLVEFDSTLTMNPYKVWFASVTLLHLIEDSETLRDKVTQITFGDESVGGDVVNITAAFAEMMARYLDSSEPRIPIAYLMLLIVLLYENSVSVDIVLSDESAVNKLFQFVKQSKGKPLLEAMSAILLGILYDFGTNISPISRSDFYNRLISIIGNDRYVLIVRRLKNNSFFRDFDERHILDAGKDDTGLAEVFFDPVFVDLVKDNFPRIIRALTRTPDMGSSIKVSYDMYQSLEIQCRELKTKLDETKSVFSETEQELKAKFAESFQNESELNQTIEKLKKDLTKHQSEFEATVSQLGSSQESIKDISSRRDQLQELLDVKENDLSKIKKQLEELQKKEAALTNQLAATAEGKDKAEQGINKMSKELFALIRSKEDCDSVIKGLTKQVQDLKKQVAKYVDSEKDAKEKFDSLKKQNADLESTIIRYKKEEQNALAVKASLENSKNNISNELNAIKAKYIECTSINESLKSKLADSAKALEDQSSAKSLNDKILEELKVEKLELESKLNELEKSVETFRSLSSTAEKQIADDQQKFIADKTALETQINAVEEKLLTSTHENEVSDKKIKDLNIEVVKLTEKLSDAVDVYEKQISQLQEELVKTNGENTLLIDKHISENKTLSDHVALLSQKQNASLLSIESLVSEKSELKDQLEILQVAKEALADEFASTSRDLAAKSELVERHDSLSKEYEELSAKYSSLESEKSHIAEELDSLKSEYKEASAAYKLTESSLKTELEAVSSNKKIVDDKIQALIIERDQLLTEKISLIQEADEAKAKFDAFESNSLANDQAQKDKISELQEKHNLLETKNKRLDEELNIAKDKLTKLESANEVLKKRELDSKSESESHIDKLNEQIRELTLKQEQLESRESELDKKLREKTSEASKLAVQVRELENQIVVLNSETNEKLEEKSSELSLLTSQVGNLENQIKDLASEKKSLSDSSKASEKHLKSEIKKISEQALKVEKQLKFSNGKSEEKEKAFDVEKSKMNERIEELMKEKLEIKSDLDKKIKELDNERELLTRDADSTTKDLSNKISLLEKEKESVQQALNKKIDILREENEKITGERDALESSNASSKEAMQNCEESMGKLKVEIEALQSDNEKFELSVEELTTRLLRTEKSYKLQLDQLAIDLKKMTAAKDILEKKCLKESKMSQEGSQKSINEIKELSEKLAKAECDLTETKILYSESIKTQSHEKNALQDSHSKELLDLQETLSTKHTEALSEMESTLSTLKSTHENELKSAISTLNSTHEKVLVDLESKQSAFAVEREKLDEKVIGLTSSLESIELENKLLTENISLVNSKVEELEVNLKTQKRYTEEALLEKAKLQEACETKLNEVTASLGKEKTELESSIKALESQKSALSSENEAFKVINSKDSRDAELEELQKNLSTEELKNTGLVTKIKSLESSLSAIELTHEEEIAKLRLEMESLQTSLQITKKERDEFSSRPSKEEFNEVMLMINDLDDKNSKYRSKLEDLGHEFSSDEDDDDEEDDDEEEDGDEDA